MFNAIIINNYINFFFIVVSHSFKMPSTNMSVLLETWYLEFEILLFSRISVK